jgi:formylglycine-generating enzyme required for sulfatase activity/Leucine-rich repeat (LRR) protein
MYPMPAVTCPPPADLERLFLGGLPTEDAEALERHVLECNACLEKLKNLFRAKDTLAGVLRDETRGDSPDNAPIIAHLIKKLESLRPVASSLPKGNPMLTLTCTACQKKLSVKEDAAGKKVKCPGCGAVMTVPVPVPAAGPNSQSSPLSGPIETSSELFAAQFGPGASASATNPSLSKPDATLGNIPHAEFDTSLTDFLAPPQADDELGRLGKYRILKILGHGGMGVVYQAEDPKLKRSVAIKAMLPTLAASASAGKRFLREAEAMAAVEHDHIVRIYDINEERGVPFLAMEFLKGEPLDARLKRDPPLPLADVLRIGREIAEALYAAHATGLIHRDIKPANIWLEAPRNRVKILDFGLARAASQESGLTQQGAIIGTPAFMSPEQARGETVDARCDLFSLGVVLYRMSTGRQPFHGKDTVSTLMEVAMHEPAPPMMVNFELPQELSDLVMKLLEKDPAKRVATAGDVITALGKMEDQLKRQQAIVEKTIAVQPDDKATSRQGDKVTKEATQPVALSPGHAGKKRRAPLVIAALLLLGGLIVVAGGMFGIIRITTPEGDFVVSTDDPDFKFSVSKGAVILEDAKTKRTYKLKAERKANGEYELDVTDVDAELSFKVKQFTIKRGERFALKAAFEPKQVAAVNPPEIKLPNGNYALRFNGKDAAVEVPSLRYDGSHPITIEAWVRPNGVPEKRVNAHVIAGWGAVYMLAINSTSTVALAFEPDAKSGTTTRWSYNVVKPDDWQRPQHLAAVWDGKRMRAFVDGRTGSAQELAAIRNAVKGTGVRADHFTIGCDMAISTGRDREKGSFFEGIIGEVRISKVARYDKDFTPAKRFEPDADTLALYHCDEGAGDVLKDSSGNGHHGKIVGAKWLKGEGAPIGSLPAAEYALQFDGKSNYVTIPTLKYEGDTPLTLEAWAVLERPAGDSPNEQLLGNPESGGFGIGASKKWYFAFHVKDEKWYSLAWERQPLPLHQLIHLAGVYDGKAEVRFYINGQLQEKAPAKGAHKPSSMPFTLGANPEPGDKFADHFFGRMNEVRISKVARYDKDFTPAKRFEKDEDTVALYHFDEGSGDVLKDSAGNGHHGKIVGAKWVKAEVPPPGPWQPLLDAKLTHWRESTKNMPNVIGVAEPEGEPVLLIKGDGRPHLYSKALFQNSHLRLEFQMPNKGPTDFSVSYAWSVGKNIIEFHVQDGGKARALPYGLSLSPANLVRGNITPTGKADDKRIAFADASLYLVGQWDRLDLVREGDRAAYFINGRFIGAVADLRGSIDGKVSDLGSSGITLGCSNGQVLIRRIEVRDISALPPELFAPPLAIAPFDAKKAQEHQQLWANHLGRPVEERNSLGMKLRLIPPGEFRMGDKGFANSRERTVRITRPYYLGALEVTGKQYLDLIKDPTKISKFTRTPELPMGFVSWEEAVWFCEVLSAHPDERKAGRRYRLPTEAEWEHACRAGTTTRYDFGDEATAKDGNIAFDKAKPPPVMKGGSFAANAWGLFDMHGNLREWVADWYEPQYSDFSPLNDPSGPTTGIQRQIRGGGANDPPTGAGFRWPQDPTAKYGDIGFRVVCEIAPKAAPSTFPPLDPAWLKAVAAMKAEQQVEAVKAELMKRNPGFDGKLEPRIEDGAVARLVLPSDDVTDLTPLKALANLEHLSARAAANSGRGKLVNLSPLKGINLKGLQIGLNPELSDLTPLKDSNLELLWCQATKVFDLSPLKDTKLTFLDCSRTQVSDLSPLKGLKLIKLHCDLTKVTDLSPLQGMPLREIILDFKAERDTEILLSITTLEKINGKDAKEFLKGASTSALPPLDPAWLKAVAAMKPPDQIEAVKAELMKRNPDFDGKFTTAAPGGFVNSIDLLTNTVTDLSPLRGFPKLVFVKVLGSPYKGKLKDLSPLADLKAINQLSCGHSQITDLTPLKGLPLGLLAVANTPVSDLTPLQGMKLYLLDVHFTKVTDLTPLKGMPLGKLYVDEAVARKNIEILRSITTLKEINGVEAKKFLQNISPAIQPLDPTWLKAVAAMTPQQQVEAVKAELMKRNPGFDGTIVAHKINKMGDVTDLDFLTDHVTDISPVAALTGLRKLTCGGSEPRRGKLADLSPLKNMNLSRLEFGHTQVSDLSPLTGTPLEALQFVATGVTDLTPLQDMELTWLDCRYCNGITDLTPLKKLKLTGFYCSGTRVTDLTPLKDMKLRRVQFGKTEVSDLTPLKDMKLTHLWCDGTKVINLSLLRGMPLQDLHCDFKAERDAEILRSIPTLETINGQSKEAFWKEVDGKKAGK